MPLEELESIYNEFAKKMEEIVTKTETIEKKKK
jgi:hypothetical protein